MLHLRKQRMRYRRRIRGGGIIDDVRQMTRNGLASLKRHAIHGVTSYAPVALTHAKRAKNNLIDYARGHAQEAVTKLITQGADKLKKVTGGQASRENRLATIRTAMNSRAKNGGCVKYIV